MKTYEDGLIDACDFILGHYEVGLFKDTGNIDPIDPDQWIAQISLDAKQGQNMLPNSRAYYDARVAMWKKIIVEKLKAE